MSIEEDLSEMPIDKLYDNIKTKGDNIQYLRELKKRSFKNESIPKQI